MERRAFLRTLGGVFVAAAAPVKTYAFFGDILRPRPTFNGGLVIKAPIFWDSKRAYWEYQRIYVKYWNLYAKHWEAPSGTVNFPTGER